MIIIGHGIDILEIERIRKAIIRTPKIIFKILHEEEIEELLLITNKEKKYSFIAKRFCAKEALAKAIGCGIFDKHFMMKKIQVKHNKNRAPYFNINEHLLNSIRIFCHTACFQIHLSISDAKNIAQASVIIEMMNEKPLASIFNN